MARRLLTLLFFFILFSTFLPAASAAAPERAVTLFLNPGITPRDAARLVVSLSSFWAQSGRNIPVFLQGSSGDQSLSFVSPTVQKSWQRRVLLDELNQGHLQAPEYLSLTRPHAFELLGAEDLRLYERTLKAYLAVFESRAAVDSRLTPMANNISDPSILWQMTTFRRFIRLELSVPEAERYAPYLQGWVEGWRKRFGDGSLSPAETKRLITLALHFYRLNFNRLERLAENIVDRMKKQDISQAAVICSEDPSLDFERALQRRGIEVRRVDQRGREPLSVSAARKLLGQNRETVPYRRVHPLYRFRAFPIRPVRTQALFDLMRDQKPYLWRLRKDLGLPSSYGVRFLILAINEETIKMFEEDTGAKPTFDWLRIALRNAVGGPVRINAPDPVQTVVDPLFSQMLRSDRKKYLVFKRLVRSQRSLENAQALDVIEKKISAYQDGLGRIREEQESKRFALFREAISDANGFNLNSIISHWLFPSFVEYLPPVLVDFLRSVGFSDDSAVVTFKTDPRAIRRVVGFAERNLSSEGMPLSYAPPEIFGPTINRSWIRSTRPSKDS